jgi:hypothetical protein
VPGGFSLTPTPRKLKIEKARYLFRFILLDLIILAILGEENKN